LARSTLRPSPQRRVSLGAFPWLIVPSRSKDPLAPRSGRIAVVLGVALLLAALAIVGVLPALSMPMLPLVLASSELSPALGLLAFAWLIVARRLLATPTRSRDLATALLALTALVTLRPLAEAVLVARRADAELQALGVGRFPYFATLSGLPSAPDVRERTVAYTAADGAPLGMRLYRRDDRPGAVRPIVVSIYGGAWRGGEPVQGARTSRALAERGYLVASIDYRHAPRSTFPAQLADVRRSLALIRDSAAAWGGDTSRLALLGRSAGGHLAELSAFAPGGPMVRGVVAIYAPWNLAEGYRDVPVPDPIGVRGVIGNFIGGTPSQRPAEYRAASPSSYVHTGLPPTLLLYGARDHLVKPEFNREAARALRTASVGVAAIEVPWAEHGFDLVPAGLGERLTWAVTERFLGAVIGDGGR
jgi:acetyl esterase/lipase